MAEDTQGTWLSPASFARLQAQLEEMTTVRRAEIAQKIEAARSEGDLRENGGYQAAREEQSKLEGRILELTHLLESAHVSEPPSAEVVGPGTVITASIAGLEERFLLGRARQPRILKASRCTRKGLLSARPSWGSRLATRRRSRLRMVAVSQLKSSRSSPSKAE